MENGINIELILAWAAAHNWAELAIDDWNVIGGSETKWRLFAKYVSTLQADPQAETDRLRYGRLAELAVVVYCDRERENGRQP